MKIKSLLLFALLLPVAGYCQVIVNPTVGYTEDVTTQITKIEVTKTSTIITFKHILQNKGAWVQLNKSIYLQDVSGEERYNYIKSEGIALRPKQITAQKPNQEVVFTVYFQKLKPGTKAINVIERARSIIELSNSSNHYFNYFNVSLDKSAPGYDKRVTTTDVVLGPPPPTGGNTTTRTISDTATISNIGVTRNSNLRESVAHLMSNMYTNMLNTQLNMYSNPAITNQLATITKNYYDALIKAGFSQDAALKIITSKQLVSVDGKL